MLVSLLIIAVILFVVYVKWRQTYWQRKGVTSIPSMFLLGSSPEIILKKVSIGKAFRMRYEEMTKIDRLHAGGYFFWDPVYVPLDPGLIKQMLTKDFHYFMGHGQYYHPKDHLTMNLFNLEGEPWKAMRTKLSPTFTSGKMKLMFNTLLEKALLLQKLIDGYSDKQEAFLIKDLSERYTTDVIGSVAFGIDCNSIEDPVSDFRKYGEKSFQITFRKILLMGIFPWNLLGNLGFKVIDIDVTKFFDSIVKETVRYRESNNIYRKDFMQLLLALKNQGSVDVLTDDEIVAQCFEFFLAGFETSSTTMTFALLELALNPDVQDKLREEIVSTIDKADGKITYNDVMTMPYLDKVVNETLRKYPPLSFLSRTCSKTYKVPNTDVVIDKGTRVNIPIWGIHMDPNYYPNPELFDPERFTEENIATRPDFTFLPFWRRSTTMYR
ncbi:hypothetical protein ABEB36_005759 [Hypothenemus hampei]|uniref:Cytochrome P450 n=1 Tax=Hypothenemus hampei TaxID=57062 RepID=A0ABD1EZZ7_HYPHA